MNERSRNIPVEIFFSHSSNEGKGDEQQRKKTGYPPFTRRKEESEITRKAAQTRRSRDRKRGIDIPYEKTGKKRKDESELSPGAAAVRRSRDRKKGIDIPKLKSGPKQRREQEGMLEDGMQE